MLGNMTNKKLSQYVKKNKLKRKRQQLLHLSEHYGDYENRFMRRKKCVSQDLILSHTTGHVTCCAPKICLKIALKNTYCTAPGWCRHERPDYQD
jgi:hypothetical protein